MLSKSIIGAGGTGAGLSVPVYSPQGNYLDAYGDSSMNVIVGEGGLIQKSPDGITWTQVTSGTTTDLRGINYNGSIYVIVGSSGIIRTSSDLVTWTTRSSGTTNTLFKVAWSGPYFVAVGANGTIRRSADGTSWSSVTSGTTTQFNGICWGGPDFNSSLFVAVGTDGLIKTSNYFGSSWTTRTSGTTEILDGITWAGSQYVATGRNGLRLTSPDGITWTNRGIQQFANAAAWNGSLITAVGNNGRISTSPDGITWTTSSTGFSNQWRGLTYNGSIFIATGTGVIGISENGIKWYIGTGT